LFSSLEVVHQVVGGPDIPVAFLIDGVCTFPAHALGKSTAF
jgi:hypothetical protein